MKTPNYWINKLNLIKHPTAGYYAETYRSALSVSIGDKQIIRSAHSSIYYLLESNEIGYWRNLKSDETFHFYAGNDLFIYIIAENGKFEKLKLGNSHQNEDAYLQLTVPANTWFALEVSIHDSYSLVACSVTPGFDYNDYQILDKKLMMKTYPQYEEIIDRFGFEKCI